MSLGNKVRKQSKVRTIEVSTEHLAEHIHSFLLAGGLIARDEVISDTVFPSTTSMLDREYIYITLKKVKREGKEL